MAEKQTQTAAAGAQTGLAEQPGLMDELLKGTLAAAPAGKASQYEGLIKTLVGEALHNTALISDEWTDTVDGLIAEIDKKLTDQVNAIIHHPEFQQLEGSWRGLHRLVMNSELSTELKIKVMDVQKDELTKMFKKNPGAKWDQTPLFKKIYEGEYGMLRGEPYGCLVGDYHFSHEPRDVEILKGMSKIAAAAHCPFITGADPKLMNMESWTEINNPPDIARLFTGPEHAAWRTLRESEDARYIGLAMPRYLAREPWSHDKNPVDAFAFDEEVEGPDHEKYCWSNAAYAMAQNINRSFALHGWCSRIRGVESGGRVDGLPTHTFRAQDGEVDMKCPTEVSLTQRREKELADAGFMPLTHAKNTDWAAFIGAQSLHLPKEYTKAVASENAKLGARLPYIFAVSRFAHFLKKMVYDKVGSYMERDKMERWLNDWIVNYVNGDPKNASEASLAERPLAEAQVEVKSVEGDPGAYTATFHLRPHFQLEALDVSLRLVSKLPARKT